MVDSIINILILFFKCCTFIYDVLTLPWYSLYQKPWIKFKQDAEPKAQPVNFKTGTTFRSLIPKSSMHILLEQNKVDTMEKVFNFGLRRNGPRKCLGAREIIDEDDEIQPNERFSKKLVMGEYMWKNFHQVEKLTNYFSRGLLGLGLKPKGMLAIFAETRAEWLIAANAAFKQNMTIVTLYSTLGEEALIHALNETRVEVVITSHQLLPKFWYVLEKVRRIKYLVYMEDWLKKTDTRGYRADVKISSFCQIIDKGSKTAVTDTTPPSPNDVAIIMYTSGSTGMPKGVQLSHRNIVSGMMAFCDCLGPIYPTDTYVAFLPLAHVLEFMIESICLISGIPIGYSTIWTLTEQSGKIKKGCKSDTALLSPTVITAVPLILDHLYKEIESQVANRSQFTRNLYNFLYDYKVKWTKRGYDTPILNTLFFSKLKQIVGGKVRLIITGGSPLSADVQQFIRTCLCCPLLQGYGLTETAACACCSLSTDRSLGRVGAPLGCCDIRLTNWDEGNYRVTDSPNPRGEILIGGDNVSIGYYKLDELTKADFIFENGRRWFRTGDIAEIDPDGCLRIIDRKKDLIKLHQGEYVSLGKIESELKSCPLVSNIYVYGDPTKLHCVALVVPSTPKLQKLAQSLKTSQEEMYGNASLIREFLKQLQAHGRKCGLQKFELPGALKLINDQWTPASGLVTAAFKLKRKVIQDKYQNEIDQMYLGLANNKEAIVN